MNEADLYSKFISKMTKYFGDEGLIIYSRSNNFFEENTITREDIMMYYELLCNKENIIPKNISKPNHIACCLFYLTKLNPEKKAIFNSKVIANLNLEKDPVNDMNMFLIFNVIEYDTEFLHSEGNKTQFLSTYLHKFIAMNKTLENFLLFQYYDALLYYINKNMHQSTKNVNSLIMSIACETEEKTNFIKYIEFRNQFLNLKIQIKEKQSDYREIIIAYKMNINDIKEINTPIAIKLSFDLYDIYYKLLQSKF